MRKITSINHPGKMPLLTLKHVLQWIPISERTLHKYINEGKIRGYKLDGLLVFNPNDIAAFLRRRAVGGGATVEFADLTEDRTKVITVAETQSYWVLNDEEAQSMFEDIEKDKDGNLTGWDSDENRPATEDPDDYRQK